jgi:polyhydroxybutyrate depolymerase
MIYRVITSILLGVFAISMAAHSVTGLRMSTTKIGLGGIDVRVDAPWINGALDAVKLEPGDYARKIVVDDRERFYKLHVPSGYKSSAPTPVVLMFHGGGGYPDAIRYQSGMDALSDKEGFIVVYPAGTNNRILGDRLLDWNDGRVYQDGSKSEIDDVAFVRAMLAELKSMLNVDTRRVYAAGFSNGAQFSFRLAREMSDQFAAVAAVAGHRSAQEFGSPVCPARRIPIIQFAGRQDPVAPFDGGSPSFKPVFQTTLKPVRETIMTWVQCNECAPTAVAETRKGQALEQKWEKCNSNAPVILWTLEDGGHTWPGGRMFPSEVKMGAGGLNKDIDASLEIWSFFKRNPLLTAPGEGENLQRDRVGDTKQQKAPGIETK